MPCNHVYLSCLARDVRVHENVPFAKQVERRDALTERPHFLASECCYIHDLLKSAVTITLFVRLLYEKTKTMLSVIHTYTVLSTGQKDVF